jgi:hypothetical protein
LTGVLSAAAAAAPTAPAQTGPTTSPAAEVDPARFLEALFGEEARKTLASADTKDDANFAAKLIESAAALKETPKFQTILCEKAYEFGIKDPLGYPSAVAAMKLLAEAAPDRKAASLEKLLNVYLLQHKRASVPERAKLTPALMETTVAVADNRADAGKRPEALALYRQAAALAEEMKSDRVDDIWRKIKAITSRQEKERKATDLRQRLEKSPQERPLRLALIQAYLVELDSPTEAAKYVDASCDEATRTFVPLAARPLAEVPEAACPQLGDWYRSLSASASPEGRTAMLTRAKTCYARYLGLHADQDASLQKAKTALEEVKRELEKIEMAAAKLFDPPKLTVMKGAEFASKCAGSFPDTGNIARQAKATASGHYQRRVPERAFQGLRNTTSWVLDTPTGWLEATWEEPVKGRYVLVFANAAGPGPAQPLKNPWGDATLTVNGGKPLALKGVSDGSVVLVDFGGAMYLRSLRIDVKGQGAPGIACIEVHVSSSAPASP